MKKRYRYHVFYRYWTMDGSEGVGSTMHMTNVGILNVPRCARSLQRDNGFKIVVIVSYTKL